MRSINQLAQETGDTSAREASRIREREASVARAWRTIAYHEGEAACTAARVAAIAELPVEFVSDICARRGLALSASSSACQSRGAHPDHFFRAFDHALSLLGAGAPEVLLSVMARGAARLGLVDAAAGYDHARLRLMCQNPRAPRVQETA